MSGPPLELLRRRLAAAKWRCEHATGPNRSYAGNPPSSFLHLP
jgi:hypothetical protein